MIDSWQTLEERFRALAIQAPDTHLNFRPVGATWTDDPRPPSDGLISEGRIMRGWKETKAGWESETGLWAWYASGPKQIPLCVEELELLIHRADRLLNQYTPYQSRFINVMLSQYGKAGNPSYMQFHWLHSIRPPNFVETASQLCALTAGFLLSRVGEGPDGKDIPQDIDQAEVEGSFTKEQVRDLTGLGDTQINNYLKQFDLPTLPAGRPKKNAPHSLRGDAVVQLLRSIIEKTNAQEFVKTKCEESLKAIKQKP